MSNIDKHAELRKELSNPAIGSNAHLRKLALALLDELEAKDKKIAELSSSHTKLREAMAGIHNTISGGGAYTPLAAILNASKRAYEESAAAEKELSLCKGILENIKSTPCHIDTSNGAFIPNSLDAWGRPVPQYLPYDFSGNPGASATQYCNGWNDAGGYWLNHIKCLQELISAYEESAAAAGKGEAS